MKTRVQVEKYRKLIVKYVTKNPNISAHEILLNLLDSYLGKNIPGFEIIYSLSRKNILFVNKIRKKINTQANFNLLESLNEYVSKSPLDKEGDFYALLIAYFTYFNDLYNFDQLDTLRKQIYIPAALYKQGKKKAQIDDILKMTEDADPQLAVDAIKLLGKLSIPENKKAIVIERLLQILEFDKPKYNSSSIFAFPDGACEALSKMLLPLEYQNRFITLLLGNPNFHNQDLTTDTLRRIDIPVERRQDVLKKINLKELRFGSLEYYILNNVADSETLGKIKNELLKKLLDDLYKYKIKEKSVLYDPMNDPTNIERILIQIKYVNPIPEQLLPEILKKVLTISDSQEPLAARAACSCLAYLFQSTSLSDIDKELIINKLINKLTEKDYAFTPLSKVQMPLEKRSEVVDILLQRIREKNNIYYSLQLLSEIDIPEQQNDIVLAQLLAEIDGLNTQTSQICKALGNVKIPSMALENVIFKLIDKAYNDDSGGYTTRSVFESLQKIPIPSNIRKQVIKNLLILVDKEFNYFDAATKIPMDRHERELFQKKILLKLPTELSFYERREMLKALYTFQHDTEINESINMQIRLEGMKETAPQKLLPHLIECIDKFQALNDAKIRLCEFLPQELVERVLKK